MGLEVLHNNRAGRPGLNSGSFATRPSTTGYALPSRAAVAATDNMKNKPIFSFGRPNPAGSLLLANNRTSYNTNVTSPRPLQNLGKSIFTNRYSSSLSANPFAGGNNSVNNPFSGNNYFGMLNALQKLFFNT